MHERFPAQVTRRNLLKATVAVLGVPAAAKEGVTYYESHKQHFYENFPDISKVTFPPEQQLTPDAVSDSLDTVKNPYFRASTVSFLHGNHVFGHASLVAVNGAACLYTIGHVADLTRDHKTAISIPGLGSTQLIPERMINTPTNHRGEEPSAYYIFGEQNTEILRSATESNTLRVFSRLFEAPQVGEKIAVPRFDKGFLRYTFDSYLREQNSLLLHGSDPLMTQSCKGDSGSPLLRMRTDIRGQEYITGAHYGVLQGIHGEEIVIDPLTGRQCVRNSIYARPNN
jgi:hypothetical protein